MILDRQKASLRRKETGEFTGKAKCGTGDEIKDKNDEVDSYPYTVVIHHLETGRKFAVDPTIKNDG